MAAHSSNGKAVFRSTSITAIGSDPALRTFSAAIRKWISASAPPGTATPNCRAQTNSVWSAIRWDCTTHFAMSR
eukprot:4652573-Alexandrium_andersonii.AAC.1